MDQTGTVDPLLSLLPPDLVAQSVEAILQCIRPAAPCCEEESTDPAHPCTQSSEPAIPLLLPSTNSEDEQVNEERKKPPKKKRSRRRASSKNSLPCMKCQLVQKKCTIVRTEPRLCARCQKQGLPECPPHGSRKDKLEQRASRLPYTELSPFMGVFAA